MALTSFTGTYLDGYNSVQQLEDIALHLLHKNTPEGVQSDRLEMAGMNRAKNFLTCPLFALALHFFQLCVPFLVVRFLTDSVQQCQAARSPGRPTRTQRLSCGARSCGRAGCRASRTIGTTCKPRQAREHPRLLQAGFTGCEDW